MAGEKKLSLKLKPKAPAAAAAPAVGAAPVAAGAPTMAASSGGITLELRGASIHIAEVIIKPKK